MWHKFKGMNSLFLKENLPPLQPVSTGDFQSLGQVQVGSGVLKWPAMK